MYAVTISIMETCVLCCRQIIHCTTNRTNFAKVFATSIPKESRIKKEKKTYKSFYNDLLDNLGNDEI